MRRALTRRVFGLASAAAALVGCTLDADRDHSGADAPRALPLAAAPRIAWVFSAGGTRGFVHVGVLKALEELQLVPDLVVGASAGALVGSLYAAGLSARAIETLALELSPLALARLAVGRPERFSGAAIADFVREHAPQTRIERLPIALAVVAERQRDGVVVAFTAGDVGVAVQASAAIEGLFAPVRIRGERYVDPDWTAPLPVRSARALGAQHVLGVDASAHPGQTPPGAERYRAADERKHALVARDAREADLVLKPDFGYWAGQSRAYRERVIETGYRATLARADALRALHRAVQPSQLPLSVDAAR